MIHFIDQKTCERTPLVATLVADVCRAVNEGNAGKGGGVGHAGRRDRVVVLGRGDAAEEAGLFADEVIACPRDALVPGGIGAMKRWVKARRDVGTKGRRDEGTKGRRDEGTKGRRDEGGDEPWVCWSGRCELLMSLVLAETLRIMPGDVHRACDAQKLAESDRSALRRQWGVGEQERVAVLLCDDAQRTAADQAMVAVGLAAETGRPWRLLLHPASKNLSMAVHITRQMGHGERLITDWRVGITWRVLAGCDAAMWVGQNETEHEKPGQAGAGLAMAWAMLSGVPIISRPHAWLSDQATAMIAGQGRAREYASLLCRVFDDAAGAERIGDEAAAWAKARFSPTAVAGWWRQLAGDER